ncbi:cuticle protein AMP1A-like [Penaeus chinensis]|uniref:cuticle protein AMP1A-like n=1 Tax=Penaeus chinensis TaxID=139456 RepID=UPI001FB813CB|nr:cuticle protein AMP1A-like [Penaeus chinensis]
MKVVLFACLIAVAFARPDGDAEVLRDEREDQGDGNFRYTFETSNGILQETVGTPGSEGQSNVVGSYRFTDPDGNVVEVRYTADEEGFRPESDAIPQPPPIPEFVYELLAIAEQQRSSGVQFDEQGFEI